MGGTKETQVIVTLATFKLQCFAHQHPFEEFQDVFIRMIVQHGTLRIYLIVGSRRVSLTRGLARFFLFHPHAGETLQLR